jgi:hypothetical protein
MLSLCLTFQAENAAGEARFDPGGCPLLRVKPLEERGLKPKDVSVAVWPTGLLDESQTHYLTQGTPTIAILAVANPLRRNLLRAWVVADIPEGVELVGVNQYLVWHLRKSEKTRRDGQPYQRFEFPCNVHPTTIPRGEQRGCWYGLYRPAALWLRTDLPEGSQPGKLFLRFRYEEKYETELPGNLDPAKAGAEDGGTEAEDDAGEPSERKKPKPTPQSEESFVHLAVLKPLSANQPKLARSGVMGRFIFNWNASQPEMPQRLADTLKQLGYNYVVTFMRWPGGTPDLGFWAEMGIQNGFEVSLGEPIPAAIRFLAAGQEVENAVTPSAIYGRDPLVEKHVFAPLRETVKAKTLSAVCANWEPYRLLSTGCESERSRDEFIRWSKLPADEVKAEWPDGVRAKRLKLYREFLNWQLGQVTKTLAETVSEAGKATGVESRMTFWMSNDALQNPPDNLLESPISVQAWGDVPCNLLTWNYYYVPKAESAKPEIDRFGAPQVVRSGALTRHLDRIFGQNRQMRLGCLYGFDQTGGYGYFLPEQVGFLHLSTVLAGMGRPVRPGNRPREHADRTMGGIRPQRREDEAARRDPGQPVSAGRA